MDTLKILNLNLSKIFVINVMLDTLTLKGVGYRCILFGISRIKAASILNNSVLEDKGVIILNNSV